MTEDLLVQEKLKKLQEIRDMGVNPYPYRFTKTANSNDLKKYGALNAGEHSKDEVSMAGRIVGLRKMGKIAFMHIQDEEGKAQLYFAIDVIGEEKYPVTKKFDYGDFIGVQGTVFKTKTGEITIEVKTFELLSKSINPLPEKFHGLKDKEIRYRQRYVDLIVNPEVKDVFRKRSLIIKAIREFLDQKGFMEVETPLLQTQYGGANARPFVTHINTWDMKMYLSISPELYLKRLVVGGFEKVFTICKNFRNEGVDHSHNPEFTMIEIYQAYADYNDMMTLIEECYEFCALKVLGTTIVKRKFEINGVETDVELDFKAPWKRITTIEAIKQQIGLDVENKTEAELLDFCDANLLEYKETSWGSLVETIFAEKVEKTIVQPTHITDRPKEGTPLCKRHRTDARLNEQCEPLAVGMELGNMYSELNDPLLQTQLLEEQAEKGRAGNEEAHQMDEDFINAIRIGMPPTGGIGWGVDRMVMLLTEAESIRDVIFFPIMKPAEDETNKKETKSDKDKTPHN